MKPSNDREAITLILTGMVEKGYVLTETADDTWNPDERVETTTVEAAVEAVMAVDEAVVYLGTPKGEGAWIYFVLGNDPEEVACNYTTNLDPDLSNITEPWWT